MKNLTALPEVASVKTVESFIPDDQQPKLAAIRQLATVLDPVLRPDPNKKPPTDADNDCRAQGSGRWFECCGRHRRPVKALPLQSGSSRTSPSWRKGMLLCESAPSGL